MSSIPSSAPSSADDGRRRRSERSREAVVDALLSLYEEGDLQPGAVRIAERAGLSERSVFRHFDDLEELASAAIERHTARVAPLFLAPSAEGDRQDRVDALVEQRLAIHDRVRMVARAGVILAESSTTVAAALDRRREVLAAQAVDQFAEELGGLDGTERSELEQALALAVSFEAVAYLRSATGVTREVARGVLVRTVDALLASALVPTEA